MPKICKSVSSQGQRTTPADVTSKVISGTAVSQHLLGIYMKNTVYLFRCYRVSMLGNMFNQTDHSTHTKIIQQYFPISESELSSNLRTQKEKRTLSSTITLSLIHSYLRLIFSTNTHTTNEHLGLFCEFCIFFISPYQLLIVNEGKEEAIKGMKLFLAINEVKHCDQPS